MRILCTSPGYKPAQKLGGTVSVVVDLAESLVRLGHKVTVYTTNSNYDERLSVPLNQPVNIDGVCVWYFPYHEPLKDALFFIPYFSQAVGMLYAPGLARKLNAHAGQFDVVHAHMPFVHPTWAAARAAKRHCKPFFYHEHGVLDPRRLVHRAFKKRLALHFVERSVMKSATTLFALTPAGCRAYRELGLENDCCVIPNGIDVENYRTSPDGMMSERLRLLDDKVVFLYFGQLLPVKGPTILLEAFLSVACEFPDTVLVYAGPDPHELKDRMMREAQRAGHGDRVLFLGTVTGEEKLDLLARADVFCLPSEAEGFSIAILEALASATPVIITPGCYFPQVEAADAGVIVDRTAEALTGALRRMLELPDLRAQMGRSARELVKRKYGWAQIARSVADAYRAGIERYRRMSEGT
jgi:glycosyltransferase involved in cell wall biosynthesis